MDEGRAARRLQGITRAGRWQVPVPGAALGATHFGGGQPRDRKLPLFLLEQACPPGAGWSLGSAGVDGTAEGAVSCRTLGSRHPKGCRDPFLQFCPLLGLGNVLKSPDRVGLHR